MLCVCRVEEKRISVILIYPRPNLLQHFLLFWMGMSSGAWRYAVYCIWMWINKTKKTKTLLCNKLSGVTLFEVMMRLCLCMYVFRLHIFNYASTFVRQSCISPASVLRWQMADVTSPGYSTVITGRWGVAAPGTSWDTAHLDPFTPLFFKTTSSSGKLHTVGVEEGPGI